MKYIKGLVLTLGLSIPAVSFASEAVTLERQFEINEQIMLDVKKELQQTLDDSFQDLILEIEEDIEIAIETSLPTQRANSDNLYSNEKSNKSLAISE